MYPGLKVIQDVSVMEGLLNENYRNVTRLKSFI